jgi:uncharacterized damage-inducible protein DinB
MPGVAKNSVIDKLISNMELKTHLIELFTFNDQTNRKLLERIGSLREKTESVKLFSHLINCQFKWLARIVQDPRAPQMSWWEPVYEVDMLEKEWGKSLMALLAYIKSKSEQELTSEITFAGFDGGRWAATPKDILLQLNFHSIHHRAQIQTIIRNQGAEPDFVDYIGTKYRKISEQ